MAKGIRLSYRFRNPGKKKNLNETGQVLFDGFHQKPHQTHGKGPILRPIIIKPGTVFKVLKPEIWSIFPILSEVFGLVGKECIITSANDGDMHKPNSKHYQDLALDLRSKHLLDKFQKQMILEQLKIKLGDKYLILFENEGKESEHYHVGYRG